MMEKTAIANNTNKMQLKLAYDLIQGIDKQNYEYIYRGKFTQKITANLLNLAEIYLDKSPDTQKLKKKIYFVMVECLQNITKHQDKVKDIVSEESAILVLEKRDGRYFVTTGNVIENENIIKLKGQLDKVNGLNQQELKVYYQEMLVTGQISHKGGAGLGLIAMARKTENKLLYDFQKVNDVFSYFYLRTEIPLDDRIIEQKKNYEKSKFSFEKIKKMHAILLEQDILLNFNGTFDRDNLINLLPIIDAQVHGSVDFKKRIYKIMFEMLHNIVNYSENHTNDDDNSVGDNPGIFLLSNKDNTLFFTAGNYIHSSKIEVLEEKINFVNKLSESELLKFYTNISGFFEKEEINKPDLSIIEMKLKSGNKLSYEFRDISKNYSFFTIQTSI
ncbi:MAG: SiaB family protein kinase [Bacteroidales bacterium]|nr:SiaB family protein kinase [Bacteroidales bacterium]